MVQVSVYMCATRLARIQERVEPCLMPQRKMVRRVPMVVLICTVLW